MTDQHSERQKQVAFLRKLRKAWLNENQETMFLAALLKHGEPPVETIRRRYVPHRDGFEQLRNPEYNRYIQMCWQTLWEMMPDEYKIAIESFKSIFERQSVARELKEKYEQWLRYHARK